jgi:hypothetical protein
MDILVGSLKLLLFYFKRSVLSYSEACIRTTQRIQLRGTSLSRSQLVIMLLYECVDFCECERAQ